MHLLITSIILIFLLSTSNHEAITDKINIQQASSLNVQISENIQIFLAQMSVYNYIIIKLISYHLHTHQLSIIDEIEHQYAVRYQCQSV